MRSRSRKLLGGNVEHAKNLPLPDIDEEELNEILNAMTLKLPELGKDEKRLANKVKRLSKAESRLANLKNKYSLYEKNKKIKPLQKNRTKLALYNSYISHQKLSNKDVLLYKELESSKKRLEASIKRANERLKNNREELKAINMKLKDVKNSKGLEELHDYELKRDKIKRLIEKYKIDNKKDLVAVLEAHGLL